MTRSLVSVVGLLTFAAVAGGCAGTRTFRPGDDAFARRHLGGRTATVVLRDGGVARGSALRVDADSTSWVDASTGQLRVVATADVARVTVSSPRLTLERSVENGVLLGTAAGFLLGAALGYDSGGCLLFCSGEPTLGARARGALTFGSFYGLAGAAEGLALGALVGAAAPAEWEFIPTSQEPTVSPP